MSERIPMASAELDESDFQAVMEVLRSGRLALGPNTVEFEQQIADYVGVKHAVAVSSGTSALHLLVRALGLGPGDEVLVPSFTFASSVNVLLYEGATPVFVDIIPDTYTLDPVDLERKVTPRTKAIMVVDVFGHPAEWNEILGIADRHALRVIDDSCEALGAEYKGRKLGQFGDAAAFAFYPNKQMTTGEGGIIVTDDDEIALLCRSMRNQGRDEMGAWLEHVRLGYNYRMDEMSAALGVSQFKRLETFLQKREQVARMYTRHLQGLEGVHPPLMKPYVRMSWFVYVVTLAEGLARNPLMALMAGQDVPTRGYFAPIHTQRYIYEQFGDLSGTLPMTESVAPRTIALPFSAIMTETQVTYVCEVLKTCLAKVISG